MNAAARAIAAGVAAAVLAALAAAAYRMGGAGARAELAAFQAGAVRQSAQAAQAAAAAQERQRALEQQRAQAAQKAIDDAIGQRDRARADAAAADLSADGLRRRLAAFSAAAGQAGGHPGALDGGPGIGAAAALDVLADLLGRVEQDGRSVAAYADQLRVAAAACERQYDAVSAAP